MFPQRFSDTMRLTTDDGGPTINIRSQKWNTEVWSEMKVCGSRLRMRKQVQPTVGDGRSKRWELAAGGGDKGRWEVVSRGWGLLPLVAAFVSSLLVLLPSRGAVLQQIGLKTDREKCFSLLYFD